MKTTRQYGFNNIGNRSSAKWGGNSAGTGLRSALYTNNTLNQLTGRGVPGGFDVMGIANAEATVTVNSSPADYRRGEYFQEAVSVVNTTVPVWQNVAVTAVNGGSSSNWPAGSVFVPRTGETFSHDADGNLTGDGRWTYTWDGENRLVRMVANTAVGPQQRLDFGYDWQGRRVSKVVWPNTGGTGTPTANLVFVYDGWNLVAELNATNRAVIRSYVWGLDLSGSEQGAGGVGGLLAVKPGNGVAQFAAYDGNGNVTALVDGTSGTYSARYEYGPFGEPIRVSGTHGSANPFRFSTKYTDDETGLLYYGHRYYNPWTGSWPNRDPLGELGHELMTWTEVSPMTLKEAGNLYLLAANDAINRIDIDGRIAALKCPRCGQWHQGFHECPSEKCPARVCYGKCVQLVPIWLCERPLGPLPVKLGSAKHSYLCCNGVNDNCFGVQKRSDSCMVECMKTKSRRQCKNECHTMVGDEIEPEVRPTGSCIMRCVMPQEHGLACADPRMPYDYSILKGQHCNEWANSMTTTSCKSGH